MTNVIDYKNMPEPKLEGTMSNGLSVDWVNWYRYGKETSLREAVDAGLKRLGKEPLGSPEKEKESGPAEPEVLSESSSMNPSHDWVKWYRTEKNCGLREAVEVGRQRVKEKRSKDFYKY